MPSALRAAIAIGAIGEHAGPGFAYDDVVPAIQRLMDAYLALRTNPDETFLQTYRRLGAAPFKAALYPADKGQGGSGSGGKRPGDTAPAADTNDASTLVAQTALQAAAPNQYVFYHF